MRVSRRGRACSVAKINQRDIRRWRRYAIGKQGMPSLIKSNGNGKRYPVSDDRHIASAGKTHVLGFGRRFKRSVLVTIRCDAERGGVVDSYSRHVRASACSTLYRVEAGALEIGLKFPCNILTLQITARPIKPRDRNGRQYGGDRQHYQQFHYGRAGLRICSNYLHVLAP